ncbi:MAG TPA: hypothetical protein VFJ57_00165 [Solirubrobacterales bacterium]|nr:hypothetical protein [Solirubrobacterales bacterium]
MVLAAVLSASLFGVVASASAEAIEPTLSGEFGCGDGQPGNFPICGSFESIAAERMFVDEESGAVYVIDNAHAVVDKFSATGTYMSQISGADTAAEAPFVFAGDSDIAVDNSGGSRQGNVYLVTEGGACASTCGIYAFDKTGSFLWEKTLTGDPCGIAVDPAGALWTADYEGGLQKRSATDGTAEGSPILAGDNNKSCHFDFDSAGDILLNHWNGSIDRYDQSGVLLSHVGDPAATTSDVVVDRARDAVYSSGFFSVEIDDVSGLQLGLFGVPKLEGSRGVAINGGTGRVYVGNSPAPLTQILVYTVPVQRTLTVTPAGIGAGSVSAGAGAISACSSSGGTCSGQYDEGSTVTLTASPAAQTKVVWSGCDSSVGNECNVTVIGATAVTATFEPIVVKHTLTVSKAGAGTGSVSCNGGSCATEYNAGTTLTLAATANASSTFAGWSGGGCSGTGNCVITLNANTILTATFGVIPPPPPAAGSGSSPAPAPVPQPTPTPKPKPLKCKKGSKKKTVKGKAKCVKAKQKSKKHH